MKVLIVAADRWIPLLFRKKKKYFYEQLRVLSIAIFC